VSCAKIKTASDSGSNPDRSIIWNSFQYFSFLSFLARAAAIRTRTESKKRPRTERSVVRVWSSFQEKVLLKYNNRYCDRYKYRYIMNNNYNQLEVMLLKGKGRIIAIPPTSSLKVLIESKIVYDSQFPLPIEKGAEIDVEIENEKLILKRVEQI
jgi:hypothetical protein